jgi:hypothetical protein
MTWSIPGSRSALHPVANADERFLIRAKERLARVEAEAKAPAPPDRDYRPTSDDRRLARLDRLSAQMKTPVRPASVVFNLGFREFLQAEAQAVIINPFSEYASPPAGPAADGFAVTSSDTVPFAIAARSLYVGGAGNVTLITLKGTTLLFTAVPARTLLPISCTQVMATGTTATNMVGLV